MTTIKEHVLLLGATSDVARALANQFGARHYGLMLAGRNATELEKLKQDLEIRYQVPVQAFEFDALDFKSHQKFAEALDPFPSTTILVFGLLGEHEKAIHRHDEALNILHSNYTGAVSVLNLLADRYETMGKGTLVGISSVAGERGRQSNYLYGSAKAGLTTYLSGLRNRLSHAGVHVLTVKPGFIATRMTEGLKLPGPLTAKPEQVARDIIKAINKKKNVIYTLWMWRYIMMIIKMIPESLFKKMKL